MTALQLVANRPAAGKTALAGALSSRLVAAGQRPAYYKPLSAAPDADPDARFLARLLDDAPDYDLPVFDPADPDAPLYHEQRQQIAAAVAGLEAAFAATLVEWAAPATPDYSPALAGYPVLLLYAYTPGAAAAAQVDAIAATAQAIGADLGGIIINQVTRHRRHETRREILTPLRDRSLPILGAIPEDRAMLAPTLQQIADCLNGRWFQEPADATAVIDRFLIGGNIMDSAPGYFGRYPGQAVITRAARPDIQLACLNSPTRLLALTGGGEPTEYIQVEARQRGVPVLLVDRDTHETAETLSTLMNQASVPTPQKIARFAALMEQHLPHLPL